MNSEREKPFKMKIYPVLLIDCLYNKMWLGLYEKFHNNEEYHHYGLKIPVIGLILRKKRVETNIRVAPIEQDRRNGFYTSKGSIGSLTTCLRNFKIDRPVQQPGIAKLLHTSNLP